MKFSVFKSCGWRRRLAVLLVFVMVLQLSVAAGAQEKAARLAETIIDQANRKVSVRFPSERIVCLQQQKRSRLEVIASRVQFLSIVKQESAIGAKPPLEDSDYSPSSDISGDEDEDIPF